MSAARNSAATATRRIAARTNPVTMVPPAPQVPQFVEPQAANHNLRPTHPNDVHNTQPQVRQRRERRSFEEVVRSLETEYEEASYATRAIQNLELRISKALNSISPEAQRLILTKRPDLQAYIVTQNG